ncbi:MAG: DUF424 domain-containing protein [Thermoplasmatota archaeon]
MFSVREYRQDVQCVLAACDEALLGTVATEGKLRLDVSEAFFGGATVDQPTLQSMMQQCTIGNFVGPETVAAAVAAGIVQDANVRTIDGVPHAQMMRL